MKSFFIKLITALIPNRNKRRLARVKMFRKYVENEPSIGEKIKTTLDWAVDVPKMPPAGGLARVVQMMQLEILIEIDRICRKHNLRYWLDYGTLLGAVRHKGFIPWDDDVDISMPYEDYLKFKEVVPQELGEDYIYTNPEGYVCRVFLKDFALVSDWDYCEVYRRNGWRDKSRVFLNVDIFPIHYLKETVSIEEISKAIVDGIDKKKELRVLQQDNIHDVYKSIASQIYETYEKPYISTEPASRMFMSLDCIMQPKPRIYVTEDIFPLREIEFEGHQFYAPGNSEMWLFTCFGEYWQPYVCPAHNDLKKLTREQMKKLIAWGREHGHL
ncbi:MAG: LicD family protein [Akkermansia sp.]|nr:LicD family protein [Akkermansia sp.]